MMTQSVNNVVVLPCRYDYENGSQRCWLSSTVIKDIGAVVGCYLKITLSDQSIICVVWPLAAECDSTDTCIPVYCDKSVKVDQCLSTVYKSNYHLSQLKFARTTYFDIMQKTYARKILIKVVVDTVALVKIFRKAIKVTSVKVKKLLTKYGVLKNSVVDLSHSRLARNMGIASIVICDAWPNDDTTVQCTNNKTEIDIAAIIDKHQFERISLKRHTRPLGGLSAIQEQLCDLLMLPVKYPQSFCKLGVQFPKGILLTGPPGTGKSSLVENVAQMCNARLHKVCGPELCAPNPGQSEEQIRKVGTLYMNFFSKGKICYYCPKI